MTRTDPVGELDSAFSSPNATPTPWADAQAVLEASEIYWLSTVRPDGRPHVTPLIAVRVDGAPWFTTGPTERKAHNLESNPHCILTTGGNRLGEGLDVVVEGEAVRETDDAVLQRVAEAFAAKYPEPFHFRVADGTFHQSEDGDALVFRITPVKVFAFGRGATYSQTRWRFED